MVTSVQNGLNLYAIMQEKIHTISISSEHYYTSIPQEKITSILRKSEMFTRLALTRVALDRVATPYITQGRSGITVISTAHRDDPAASRDRNR